MSGRGLSTSGRLLISVLVAWCLGAGAVAAFDDQDWVALAERSREVLSSLAPAAPGGPVIDPPETASRPRTIVVGFTGGIEGGDSRISGVVRLRRKIEQSARDGDGVVALTYNNRDWRPAAAHVLSLIGRGETAPGTSTAEPIERGEQPLIIAYGHSWGAGAVTKFARALGEGDATIALAVYIDAFTFRNPRVPANVHYAVNLYQRTGIFRGFPLRGKSKLVLESPDSTVVLGNLRITPETEHFGWHWNLVQPLLYRHHHRMSHDVRLQQYLLDLVPVMVDSDAETAAEAPSLEFAVELPAASEAAGLRY